MPAIGDTIKVATPYVSPLERCRLLLEEIFEVVDTIKKVNQERARLNYEPYGLTTEDIRFLRMAMAELGTVVTNHEFAKANWLVKNKAKGWLNRVISIKIRLEKELEFLTDDGNKILIEVKQHQGHHRPQKREAKVSFYEDEEAKAREKARSQLEDAKVQKQILDAEAAKDSFTKVGYEMPTGWDARKPNKTKKGHKKAQKGGK